MEREDDTKNQKPFFLKTEILELLHPFSKRRKRHHHPRGRSRAHTFIGRNPEEAFSSLAKDAKRPLVRGSKTNFSNLQ